MANLLQEVWLSSINELIYPDNSVINQSVSHDEYTNYNKVHVPNAGLNANIVMNRTNFATTFTQRTDNDLSYTIDSFSTDPIGISDLETHQINYDKRKSLLYNTGKQFETLATSQFLYRIVTPLAASSLSATSIIYTSGAMDGGVAPVMNLSGATASGSRSGVTIQDIFRLKTVLDNQNIPDDGSRVLLIPANLMNNELIQQANILQAMQFGATNLQDAPLPKGAITRLAGFNIYTRPTTLAFSSGGTLNSMDVNGNQTIAATDCSAILAWHPMFVGRAKSPTRLFEQPNSPYALGSVIAFDFWFGGSLIRSDNKGLAVLVQHV